MRSLDGLAHAVGRAMKERGLTLTTAESCTGGGVAEAITRIAGSSEWFDRGFVTYSNAAKREMLGVSAQTLQERGAVSEEVVREMVVGALRDSSAQVAIAVSGVAGPSGGTPEKPVGTVCFCWAMKDGAQLSATRLLPGDRQAVREKATIIALQGVLDLIHLVAIRAQREADDVAAIHRAAFTTESEAKLVEALRAHGNVIVSLVAECETRLVGNIVFSAVLIVERPDCRSGLGLAPVAVLPDWQRRGIGGKLVRAGLDVCKNAGFGFVVVLGDPGFYECFGFERASGRGLRNEYGAESEFMVIELVPQSIPATGGLVKYAPEFVKLVFDRG